MFSADYDLIISNNFIILKRKVRKIGNSENMTIKKRPTVLIHACCAPDATVVIERMREDYDITIYFYNPNIQPESEYKLRVEEMKRLATEMNIACEIGPYDFRRWLKMARGMKHLPEGGKRCEICFKMRLEQTAQKAAAENFDFFTTVLTVSPHKDAALINAMGREIGAKYQVKFIEENFKKKDGFKRSIELSRIYSLYRQNYCGCIYSKRD